MNRLNMIIGTVALGFSLCAMGCATTTNHGPRHTDGEVEAAIRQTEADTLARMCAGTNREIADAAAFVARSHATR
jgi:hypothetical protein